MIKEFMPFSYSDTCWLTSHLMREELLSECLTYVFSYFFYFRFSLVVFESTWGHPEDAQMNKKFKHGTLYFPQFRNLFKFFTFLGISEKLLTKSKCLKFGRFCLRVCLFERYLR